MSFLKHFFKKHSCVDNIFIDDTRNSFTPALICGECNREIGFTYFDGDVWKVFVYPRFNKYRLEIENWTYEHTKDRTNMGDAYGQSWEGVLCDFKQWCKDSLSSMGCERWDGECEEDSEGYEPDRLGEEYILGVDLASGASMSF